MATIWIAAVLAIFGCIICYHLHMLTKAVTDLRDIFLISADIFEEPEEGEEDGWEDK